MMERILKTSAGERRRMVQAVAELQKSVTPEPERRTDFPSRTFPQKLR